MEQPLPGESQASAKQVLAKQIGAVVDDVAAVGSSAVIFSQPSAHTSLVIDVRRSED